MNPSAEAKLNELRGKTNRQLIELISNRLDRGLMFADLLADSSEGNNWSSLEEFLVRAETAHSEATSWLRLVSGATQLELRRLTSKLARLSEQLNQASRRVRVQSACS
jgi:hypothetical protein